MSWTLSRSPYWPLTLLVHTLPWLVHISPMLSTNSDINDISLNYSVSIRHTCNHYTSRIFSYCQFRHCKNYMALNLLYKIACVDWDKERAHQTSLLIISFIHLLKFWKEQCMKCTDTTVMYWKLEQNVQIANWKTGAKCTDCTEYTARLEQTAKNQLVWKLEM